MQISLSTSGICDFGSPGQYFDYILDAGFFSLVLDQGAVYTKQVLEAYEEKGIIADIQKVKETWRRLAGQCAEQPFRFPFIRMPFLKADTKRTDLNEWMRQAAKDGVEQGARTDCRGILVQPLFAGVRREKEWSVNHDYFMELGRLAQGKGMQVLLQNQCRSINGHLVRGICADGAEAIKWIDTLNAEMGEERFGFCLDTGICILCGQDMREMTVALGNRIKAVFLRECDGRRDSAQMPFMGSGADWAGLIRGLRRIEFDGDLILDVSDTLKGYPLSLRPQLYGMAKSLADYFVWQVEMEKTLRKYASRVLFGAGRMCRNYMKCYGDQYPPLFTCDNNEKLWGTTVCGLEVRPPEALKDLPEDCGVFICHTFYEQTEGQLCRMGIRSVERFNDEFLPFIRKKA